MTREDILKLRKTVSDVIFAANRNPEKWDGSHTLELAKGCRQLIDKVEAVQNLSTEIKRETEELGRIANIVYQSIVRIKKMAEVASKAIGE